MQQASTARTAHTSRRAAAARLGAGHHKPTTAHPPGARTARHAASCPAAHKACMAHGMSSQTCATRPQSQPGACTGHTASGIRRQEQQAAPQSTKKGCEAAMLACALKAGPESPPTNWTPAVGLIPQAGARAKAARRWNRPHCHEPAGRHACQPPGQAGDARSNALAYVAASGAGPAAQVLRCGIQPLGRGWPRCQQLLAAPGCP